MACLERGVLNRSTDNATFFGECSRSHVIFTIILEQYFFESLNKKCSGAKEGNKGESDCPEFMIAKFHFLDIEGSKKFNASQKRLRPTNGKTNVFIFN